MKIIKVDKPPNLERGQLWGLDTETLALPPFDPSFEIRLLQLATKDTAWIFRMDNEDHVNWCRAFINDDSQSFVCHTDFDFHAIRQYLKVDENFAYRYLNSHILAILASPEDRLGVADLDTLSSKYLGPEYKKNSNELMSRFRELFEKDNQRKGTGEEIKKYGFTNISLDDDVFTLYAGKDAIAVRQLVDILIPLTGAPMSLLRMELWLSAQSLLMREKGMKLDLPAYRKLYKEAKETCDFHAEEFGKIVQEPFLQGRGAERREYWKPVSTRSGKKVAKFLYQHGADFTGFPLTEAGQKLADKEQLSYEDEVSGKYASLAKDNKPLVALMNLDYDGQQAALHLFGHKDQEYTVTKLAELAKVQVEGTVHPILRTCGTVTGRASSASPNFQNFSRSDTRMREIFIANPGYTLIGCDLGQVEIRVAAGLSQDPVLVSAVTGGKDMHTVTMEATGIDRPAAKIFNFSILYGAGPKAVSKQTGLPYEDCRGYVKTFWKTYPGLAEYRDYVQSFTTEIRTISNRRIPVAMNPYTHEPLVFKNLNYVIQSAAREFMVSGWYRYVTTPGTETGKVLLSVHDELVAEVPVEELEFHKAALENSMNFYFNNIPIVADAIELKDSQGVARWTTGTRAKEYAQ